MDNLLRENKNVFLKIIEGIILSFVISLLSMFLFSIVLIYSNITEDVIPIIIIMINFISIFIASFVCMKKMNKNGMINGLLIGGAHVILLYVLSSLLNTGFTINTYSITMIITGIISGILGRDNRNKYIKKYS